MTSSLSSLSSLLYSPSSLSFILIPLPRFSFSPVERTCKVISIFWQVPFITDPFLENKRLQERPGTLLCCTADKRVGQQRIGAPVWSERMLARLRGSEGATSKERDSEEMWRHTGCTFAHTSSYMPSHMYTTYPHTLPTRKASRYKRQQMSVLLYYIVYY